MSDQNVTLRITANASGLGPATKAAKEQVDKIGEGASQANTRLKGMGRSGSEAGEQVAAGAQAGAKSIKEIVREAAQAQMSVKSLVQSAASLAAVFGGGVGIKQFFSAFVQAADLQGRMESQLQRVSQTQAEYNSVLARTRQIADDAFVSVNAVTEVYVRSIEPMRQLGRTSKDTLDLSEALSLSLVVSSASADKQASAIDALSKVMQSGRADMNGFMSLVNTAPRFVEALEKALGKTRAELIAMVSDGQLTASTITAVSSQIKLLRDEVAAMPTELADAGVRFRNEFQAWAAATNEQLGVTRALVSGLELLSNNIGPLVSTVAALAAAWAVRYVGGLVVATLAARAKLQQNVALATSELALARAAEATALALHQQALASGGLTAANQALAAAQARTTAATTALNAAQAANISLASRAGTSLLALAGGPWGVLLLAIGAVAAATYNAIQAERERQAEFDAIVEGTHEAADATDRFIQSLSRIGGAMPPSINERLQEEAELIGQLATRQEALTAARERYQEVLAAQIAILSNLGAITGAEQLALQTGEVQRAAQEILALEDAYARLSGKAEQLARVNDSSLGPAIDAMTARFRELSQANDDLEAGGGISGFFDRVFQSLNAGTSELEAMNSAYRSAQEIAAKLTEQARKSTEELRELGMTEAERATSQLALWEEAARASGALSEAQIQARKSELEAAAASISALEREQRALRGRAEAARAAAREAERARREQLRGWNESLRASQSFRDRLAEIRAELGGPLAQAQLRHQNALASIAELARAAGAGTEELAEAQSLLNQLYEAEAAEIQKKLLEEAGKAAKDAARELEQLLDGLENTGFRRLIADIELVGQALEEATDPAMILRLENAMAQLQQTLRAGMVDAASEALRGVQSLTENGSKAFRAMQVAIDALALVQGISAILNQGTGDPYSAPVRMALMAAAIAPLIANLAGSIGSFGGASGFTDTAAQRQAAQGTGTVLGDAGAKSDSILRASEITAGATSELVGINRGMLRALVALQSGLDRAGGLLARGAANADFSDLPAAQRFRGFSGTTPSFLADPLNILGGRSRVTDQGIVIMGDLLEGIVLGAYQEVQSRSWRFGRTRTNEEVVNVAGDLRNQFQLVIDSIVDTVREGALALGLLPDEIEAALAAFRIEEIRISLKDLSAEEQQRELQAVFGAIFDGLAGDVVPWISQFQRVGEGLGETLVRVATGVQVTREAIDRLGFSLDEVGPERFAQISESLIEMIGGIEEFVSGMRDFIEAFAPESRKFELLQSDLTRAFAQAGLEVPATRDAMWELMQSLDATTESGREQIATLLRLRGTANAYYTMLERGEQEQARALEAQLQALADYRAMVDALRSELDDVGMSSFAREMRDIDRWATDARDALHEAARAAGQHAAAEEDLALVHQVAAQRAAAAIERLRSSAADLVAQLYGTPLDQIESEIRRIEEAQSSSTASQISAIEQVGAAAQRVYEAQLAALQGIQAWLDSQQLGDLSTLTPAERLAEAQRQFEATLLAAQAGDVDALQSITRQADALLREGFSYYGTPEYMALEQSVRSALQGLVNTGPLASPSGSDSSLVGSPQVVMSSELQALYERRDELLNQQMAQQREAVLRELGGMVRELIAATEKPLEEVAASIGLNLSSLAADLGINLQELSLETATGLADLARQLGVDVAELAASVGVELGSLADRQSLLNQALDRTLEGIPEEFRNQLRGPLDAIREATTEADATAAVTAAETAILGMPAGIRNLLAPFFDGIKPPPVITELTRLGDIAATAGLQLVELSAIRAAIEAMAEAVTTGEGLPSYDVGTAFVPRTGPALVHAGEAILPASVNAWAQRNGLTIGPAQGGNTEAVVAELRALREQQARAAEETLQRLERVEQAQRDGSVEISREQRRTGDLIQQRGR